MESRPILNNQASFISTDNLNNSTSQIQADSGLFSKLSGLLQSIKKRYVLSVYAFFGFFIAYSLRANLSVAIVDMSKVNSLASSSNSTSNGTSKSENWSPVLQGYILSSFFYGYIVTQLPAAFLTSKYGGRLFFGGGIGICSFLTLLMPLAAYFGPGGVIFIRILQGLAQGFIFPAMHCLWSKWAPPSQRSRLATFSLSGSYVGSVVALGLGGLIGNHINWQSIFYIFGAVGVVWSLLWFYHIYESPSNHNKITSEEKLLIESSLEINDYTKIPWLSIIRSPAVWAIIGAHFAENWGFYTMLTEMPTFFSEIMGYKLDKAGLLSSMPYLVMAIALYLSGNISDLLIERKNSYTNVRKIFCCSGLAVQAIFMFIMTLSSNSTILIICITLGIGFGGLPWASFGVNHLDIGAGYANVLMSISNTFASIPGIVSPILTGHLIEHHTKLEWNVVFLVSSIILLGGAVVYFVLGTGETQYWATRSRDLEVTNSSAKSSVNNALSLNESTVSYKTGDNGENINIDNFTSHSSVN